MFEARVAPTPKDTVFRDGKGSVYRFRGAAENAASNGSSAASNVLSSHVPVLLVPSMINRWYVLDLREGASLATALSAGSPWETYCFDWGIPEDEDRYMQWDEVVGRLDRVVRRVLRMTGAPKVAIVGYCMGGTLSGIYTALHPEKVAALVNLAGPFDFSEAGRLGTMVDPRWFDAEAMTAPGNLSALQMQSGFLSLAPTGSISKWIGIFDKMHDPRAREAFGALEKWAGDNIPFRPPRTSRTSKSSIKRIGSSKASTMSPVIALILDASRVPFSPSSLSAMPSVRRRPRPLSTTRHRAA